MNLARNGMLCMFLAECLVIWSSFLWEARRMLNSKNTSQLRAASSWNFRKDWNWITAAKKTSRTFLLGEMQARNPSPRRSNSNRSLFPIELTTFFATIVRKRRPCCCLLSIRFCKWGLCWRKTRWAKKMTMTKTSHSLPKTSKRTLTSSRSFLKSLLIWNWSLMIHMPRYIAAKSLSSWIITMISEA